MKKIAVFAGSFDPVTVGHVDVIGRAAAIFDELYVLVAVNAAKKYLFSEKIRVEFLKAAIPFSNVKVSQFDGLTVDFMKQVKAKFLVRGFRGSADIQLEQAVDWNNKTLYNGVETVFFNSRPEHLAVSSSVVRELLKCGVDEDKLVKFVPKEILPYLKKEYK